MFRMLSLCACCRHYPGAATGRIASLTLPSRVRRPEVGLLLLSVHSRCGLRTRAVAVFRDALSSGCESHPATAPAESWLKSSGKRRVFTAH